MANASFPESSALAYATPASFARVTYARDGARATVVVPRPERRGKAVMDATGNAIGELLVCVIFGGGLLWWWSPILLVALIPVAVALFGAFYAVAWLCLNAALGVEPPPVRAWAGG